ncbi:thiamine phosphate synthase [Sphingobium aromaticiconvertens]|uniref:thiamine phosphate synthase n=1 Tax=Sphingobium aromaticiconvertens TaxID=365341 RepID=UPI003017ACB8
MTGRHRKNLPSVWLMTDERIADATLLATVARLPRGRAGIVFRHYRTPATQRRALFAQIAGIAHRRRLMIVLAGTARTAAAWKADGWHGPNNRTVCRPLIHSQAAHDVTEIKAAERSDANLLFLSPLFPTRSHPGATALGRAGFASLARQSILPVIALGGVRSCHQRQLKILGASGWAAIDGLTT